jgi:flagellar biosynthetic protein FliR
MASETLIRWVVTSLLLGLRVGPVFAVAPPFTLTRTPTVFRVFMGLGLAGVLASSLPQDQWASGFGVGDLLTAGARELMLGAVFALAFQVMFAGLYVAGRTVDIQAGFGLAMLIDPTTRGQSPLVGTLLAYAAGAVFFAMNGHVELLRLLRASVEAVPLGAGQAPTSLRPLITFMSVVFLTSFGAAATAVLTLFLADVAIALMSRTLPQMNVLILGLQVKTLLLLAVLPAMIGGVGAVLARLARLTLEALPGLI